MTPAASPPPNPAPAGGVLATSVRPAAELAAHLEDRGWHVAVVSGAPTRSEALRAIGVALDFPAYYGRNLDALNDCLRDLERPTALVWAGWEPLAVQRADDWAALLSVLSDRVTDRQLPPFAVFCTVETQP